MPAAAHPITTVIVDNVDTDKSATRDYFVNRTGVVLADAGELNNTDLQGAQLVVLKSTGRLYTSDTADVSTADDGVLCIRDANGIAYKRVSFSEASEGISASSISVVDAGSYFTGTDVETVLQEIGADLDVLSPAIVTSPARPEDHGAVGDGTTDDTTAVQAALNDGNPEIRFDNAYKCGALTLASANKLLFGRGSLKQKALGSNLLVGSSLSELVISVDLTGAASLNTTPASSNDAINLTDCDNVTVQDCTIQLFRFRPLFAQGGTNLRYQNVRSINNAVGGPRCIGVKELRILRGLIDGTCLASDQFTTGIGLESTDGYSYGVCEDVWIEDFLIKNIINAQAILVHGGKQVKIRGNEITGAIIGISLNPYNSTDYITNPIVANNSCDGPTDTWAFGTSGNSQIVCQAGGSTPNITQPVITGNFAQSGNRSKGGAAEGGLQIGWADDAMVYANTLRASKGNGIVANTCVRANFHANNIATVLSGSGGEQNGIKGTSCTGFVDGNFLSSAGTAVDASGMTLGTNPSIP